MIKPLAYSTTSPNFRPMIKLIGFKGTLFLLILIFSIAPVEAQWETDKQLHFAGGALFGLAGAGLGRQFSNGSPFWTFTGSIAGSTVVGVAKEWSDDRQNPGSWSNGDLLATLAGGAFTGILLHLFLKPKRTRGITFQGQRTYEIVEFPLPPGFDLLGAPSEIQNWVKVSP